MSYWEILILIHIIGLVLGVGAATVKAVFLIKTRSQPDLTPIFFTISRTATPMIVLGMILLTLSGIIWIILGYKVTLSLAIKLILVLIIWVLGIYMDNFVEPKFNQLARVQDKESISLLKHIQQKYLVLEIIATLIFYSIIIYWILVVE